ncbi:hypothetical protein DEJ49_29565 [Streptomyces venezuelae]|uniref:Restriction endonuclease type IV Mrr domain-containing protein n=1 Tax=Streptomyces venezuelae TaxID=54571 RepID=A0A5P2CS67_STRVZ|nr:hypothetical protein DEJ49_29565 [Streptomyces venezuelae]
MGPTVSIRCPKCGREHAYAPPSYPCACGAPVAPAVCRDATPEPVTDRTWAEAWITARCAACGHEGHWPRPELDCSCGTVLGVPVVGAGAEATADEGGGREGGAGDAARSGVPPGHPSHIPLPRTAPRPRPAFRPVTIRDARDAVTVAALYLRWLGYLDTRSAARRPPSGSRIAARGMLAQVEPALRPTTSRDVECLWLTALTEAGDTPVACAFFSLSGYTSGARTRADSLGVPLFTMDATGTPQPVNGAAYELAATGA